jgi:transcription termination/antitermination protein NusA
MSIVKSEFALALNQVATERGIAVDEVITSIESAILAAYHKEMHETGQESLTLEEQEVDESITVKINRDTGEAKVFKDGANITPPGFGRIATQTAKQIILQKIREAEKKTVLSHYKGQMGTVQRGRIIRFDGYNAYVDIGKLEAILPKDEQIRNEKYAVNTSLQFFLKEIAEDKFGNSRIIVSRSAPEFIMELFKREVPEIANGTVEIKKVVREPGERAKIAVYSAQGGVDPVGACVGQKGIRVQTVTNELGGDEKIDIIQWNKDHKTFLTSALSPAKITDVELDVENKKARVIVEESQAPLAIGKNGINVNLASKLTEYDIDIIQTPSTSTPETAVEPVTAEETPVAAEEVAETPTVESETPVVEETPTAETTEGAQESTPDTSPTAQAEEVPSTPTAEPESETPAAS